MYSALEAKHVCAQMGFYNPVTKPRGTFPLLCIFYNLMQASALRQAERYPSVTATVTGCLLLCLCGLHT